MANCESCKFKSTAPENVPYIVHELSMARMERQIKRLWIALLVAIAMIVATNAAWLVYEAQFDTFEYSYEQDGSGTNIIGDGNDVNNGAEAENQD